MNGKSVNEFDLIGNRLDDESLKLIFDYISINPGINKLSLGSKISDTGIRELAQFTTLNISFETLNFSFNKEITDLSVPFILQFMQNIHIKNILFEETSIISQHKNLISEISRYFNNKQEYLCLENW